MAQIGIGQRVRVIDGDLMEYKQCGTVVAAGTSNSWYVRLDGAEQAAGQTFFQVEELQTVEPGATGPDQTLAVVEEITA